MEAAPGRAGTTVEVRDLFFNLPGRRKFMKTPSAESGLCRSVFLEKALAFPGTAFRLFGDGVLRTFLPPSSLKERLHNALSGETDQRMLHELSGAGEGFSLVLLAGSPDAPRRDRRLIQVYVNRRRVQEYGLVQAVEHAYSGLLPGGLYPACFIFLDIDPALADFNIHPAKKEVRLRTLPNIRRRLIEILNDYLRERPRTVGLPAAAAPAEAPALFAERSRAGQPGAGSSLDLSVFEPAGPRYQAPGGFTYHGQIFNLFLAVERGDRLYLIDQHAAHERVLYDRFAASTRMQRLLVPLVLDLTGPECEQLAAAREELRGLGIELADTPTGLEITALSEALLPSAAEVPAILSDAFFDRAAEKISDFHALAACRAAVKDGQVLERAAAIELADKALALPTPRCPHGRPVWFELSREELFRLVGRIV
jgi:DNA mismatch repair protein MutL